MINRNYPKEQAEILVKNKLSVYPLLFIFRSFSLLIRCGKILEAPDLFSLFFKFPISRLPLNMSFSNLAFSKSSLQTFNALTLAVIKFSVKEIFFLNLGL